MPPRVIVRTVPSVLASAPLVRLLDLASADAERAGAASLTAHRVAETARSLATDLPSRPVTRRTRLDGDLLLALSAVARDTLASGASEVSAHDVLREIGLPDDVSAAAAARLQESLDTDPPSDTERHDMLIGAGPLT